MIKLLSMKSFAVSAILCGLLAGVTNSSSALTWTFDIHAIGGVPGSAFGGDTPFTTIGVDTAASQYTTVFQAPPVNPKNYITPTGVTYGTLFTTELNLAPTPDSFPLGNMADFNFDVYPVGAPGSSHTFTAFGTLVNLVTPSISGTTTAGTSNAAWNLLSIKDNTSGIIYTPGANSSMDPLTGAPSILFNPIIDGKNVSIWMEKVRQVPAPGQTSVINGYIADVPEPGTVALLVGSGIGGSLMLRRRRRA